ncbi:MAG: hypothetical protein V1843_00370 [bacterium]
MRVLRGAFLFFIILTFLSAGASAAYKNLITNGSFEKGLNKYKIPNGWGTESYNQSVVGGGKVDKKCLMIRNDAVKASLGAQEFALDGTKIPFVTLSAWIKIKDVVKGKEDWDKANVQILFFDQGGTQVGGWPEIGPWVGTADWKKYFKTFAVPKGTVKAKVVMGLVNASGTVWFDDIQVNPRWPNQDRNAYDLISGGDFEIYQDWAYGGSEDAGVIIPGYNSVQSFRISNAKSMWSFLSQNVELDGRKVARIKVVAMVRTDNVVSGENSWEKARINLEFKDQSGTRIGGWPLIFQGDGTIPWKRVEASFNIPEETRRVDLYSGLLNCSGTVYYDNIQMYAVRSDGSRFKPGQPEKFDPKGYYPFRPEKDDFTPSAIDVSFLLDAPSGKYGFMKVKDGHFYFDNGKRARFWGVNISGPAAFMSHEDAERMANRLAKYGCNLVRLHHLDAYWAEGKNIFDPTYNDTQHFSAEKMDQLDYFISKLKENGIYVFLDLLVHRKFKEGDNIKDWANVTPGAKFEAFYDPRIIELQKQYANDLLKHRNSYTGLEYRNDPTICSVKIINEATLHYLGTMSGLSPIYLADLDKMFNTWLLKRYGSKDGLNRAWYDSQKGVSDLKDGEDPLQGTVKRGEMVLAKYRDEYRQFDLMREADTSRFYSEVESKYYREMRDYLRGIGVKVPLSGSNHWENILADIAANSELDYIDRHRYWDHPRLAYGTKVLFDNLPMVNYPDGSLPVFFAAYKVAGKPYSVSEWNNCWPNLYIAEGPMIMAAYSVLQDWDAVLQFDISSPDWINILENNFDIAAWPTVLGQWPAAALLFHRQDVSASNDVIKEVFYGNDIHGLPNEDKPVGASGQEYLPLVSRVERSLQDKTGTYSITGDSAARSYYDNNTKQISSDTRELFWNYAEGVVMVNTPKTQSVVGFLKGKKFQFYNVLFEPKTEFAAMTLSSLDGEIIARSKRLLLTAAGKMRNTGQLYSESKTQLKTLGKSPILLEGVVSKVSLTFESPGSILEVWKLDANGYRTGKIDAVRVGNSFIFEIGANDKAICYEISR